MPCEMVGREMGCSPLGKIVSKALGKCNGRERWREERMDYAMAYPPGPPTETRYMRSAARTVTFSGTNSVYVIPPADPPPPQQGPEPQHQAPPPQHEPDHQTQPQHEPPAPAPEQAPPPSEPKRPKRGKKKHPGRVRFGPDPPPQQQQQQPPQQHPPPQQTQHVPVPSNNGHGPAPGAPQGYFRYTPSPLPRWEATPRRHEYFSGEYRYSYPTPVREGIYSIATDANRLTTIFSEENPNACTIA